VLNLLVEILTIGILHKDIFPSIFLKLTALFNIIINSLMIIFMCKTTRRTYRYSPSPVFDMPDPNSELKQCLYEN
jgi:hypothetical protein